MRGKQKVFSYCVVLTCIVLFNSGCIGMIGRGMLVGDEGTYAELSDSLPPIQDGQGRVFIYMTNGGPSPMNTMGIIGEPITVDEIIHFVTGKTFFYVDLDAGEHQLTATNTTKGAIKRTFRKGENEVGFTLSNQDTKYIRIDFKGTVAYPRLGSYHPVLLEANETAENEISELKIYTEHNHGMLGDKMWKIGDTFI